MVSVKYRADVCYVPSLVFIPTYKEGSDAKNNEVGRIKIEEGLDLKRTSEK